MIASAVPIDNTVFPNTGILGTITIPIPLAMLHTNNTESINMIDDDNM